jgi:hypothetical protein
MLDQSLHRSVCIRRRNGKFQTAMAHLTLVLVSVTPNPRSAWKHERNPEQSWFATAPQRSWFSSIDFARTYRLKRSTFEILCIQLAPYAQGETTRLRDPVPLHVRVAMFVERCATGNTFHSIGKNYGFPHNTVHKLFDEVANSFQKHFIKSLVKFPTTIEELQRLASAFARRRGLLNCVGAVDGQ